VFYCPHLYFVFCSIKIFSNLEGSFSKQLFIPSHVIILFSLVTRDNSQCWLLVDHVHRLFMFQSAEGNKTHHVSCIMTTATSNICYNVFSNLFDMSVIYDCFSTEWCTFFIITCVLPLITSTKLYHTCPRYKHNIYFKNSNKIRMCYHLHCLHFYFVFLSH
jgi:hypothetical protein